MHQLPRALAHGHAHVAIHGKVPEDRLAHRAVCQSGGGIAAVQLLEDITAIQGQRRVGLRSSQFHESGKQVDQ